MLPRIKYILLIWLICIFYGCTPSDYCEEAGRSLSDAELIAKVVDQKSYYPNCCRVNRDDGIEIDVYKKVSDADEQKQKYPELAYYEEHLKVNACGEILDRYGMHVKDKERPCWTRKEAISTLSDNDLIRAALDKAAKGMKLEPSVQSINQFMIDHPSCCHVQRNVKDENNPAWINPAQVEVYYMPIEKQPSHQDNFSRILVAFNSCGDWSHMYGPGLIDKLSVPEWVK